MCCVEEHLKLFNESFCDRVSFECISKFNSLGKSGKPVNNEWIVVACFLKAEFIEKKLDLKVVSLGTGSKCIGKSNLPCNGDRLLDSHAEVISRRAFKLYLMEQLKFCFESQKSIFSLENNAVILREGISFHFYCSNVPCGDASIFPKCSDNFESLIGSLVGNDSVAKHQAKKLKISDENISFEDIYRTGGKCVSNEPADPKEDGASYHVLGALRTKPGRGDPTLSHCCSDKIFKWTVLGIQGALISLFLKYPIYIETFIIGSGPYSKESLERSIYLRFKDRLKLIELKAPFKVRTPLVMQANSRFPFAKPAQNRENKLVKPSPTSIIWSDTKIHLAKTEVSVDGKRLGTSKKNESSSTSRVSICRMELMKRILELANIARERVTKGGVPSEAFRHWFELNQSLSYGTLKKKSEYYHKTWTDLREIVFLNWTEKPDYAKNFIIGND